MSWTKTPRIWTRAAAWRAGILLFVAGGANAAGVPRHFEAPWMGFDTGWFPEAFGPVDMAAGDLDGDGDLDVVVAQDYFWRPGVSVLLNHGDGTYAPPVPYLLGNNDSVARVAIADLDEDGDLDVVATIPDTWGLSDRVGLWRNDGAGVLSGPARFPTGEGPVGLAVADFDGDDHLDVVTADHGYNGQGTTVTLLRHNGAVGIAAALLAPESLTVGDGPRALAAGDLDGDADIDVVVGYEGTAETQVAVLANDGAGSFTVAETYALEFRDPTVLALADLDRDGDLDLVTGSTEDAGVTWWAITRVWYNNGAGQFPSWREYPLDTFSWRASDFAIADLNHDCYPDIVSTHPDGRAFDGWRVLLSDGAGGFRDVEAHPNSQNTDAVLAVDADGDAHADVLTLAHFSAALTVHRNPGSGLFPQVEHTPVDAFIDTMDAGDIDGDGDLDIALSAGRDVQILVNNGDGSFAPPVRIDPPPTRIIDLTLRDLTGDDLADLVLLGGPTVDGASIVVAPSTGDASFPTYQTLPIGPCAGADIGAFDLDGDSDLDVAVTNCVSGFNRWIVLARNDGDGSLTKMPDLPTYVSTFGLDVADLDGDTHADLVTIESGFGLGVFLGNGDFTFAPEIREDSAPYRFGLGDFDGDSRIDAAIVIPADAFGTDTVGICFGRGDGSFEPPVPYPGSSVLETLRVATDLEVGDADCDGRPDVIVTNYASNDLSVHINAGDGTLLPQVRYGPGHTPMHTVLGDFTGDGVSDLATTAAQMENCCDTSVVVLRGLCACGDGVLDPGEDCDDGNNLPGDPCLPDCTFNPCGNGLFDPGETCDDGNTESGDGCSASCLLESGDPCASGCHEGALLPVRLLKAVKDRLGGDDAVFRWQPSAGAAWYHLNAVAPKSDLVDPRRIAPGNGRAVCDVVAPATSCIDIDAVTDPERMLYYQVLAACGQGLTIEGPF